MCKIIHYSDLKYRIKYYLERIPRHDYVVVCSSLPVLLNIESRTFKRYCLARKDDTYQVPSLHLIKLAKFFSNYFNEIITSEDLVNVDVEIISMDKLRNARRENSARVLRLVR